MAESAEAKKADAPPTPTAKSGRFVLVMMAVALVGVVICAILAVYDMRNG